MDENRTLKYLSILCLVGFIVILVLTKGSKDKNLREKNLSLDQDPGSTLGISAEVSGSSPNSGVDSKLKQAYDFLVSKGSNYGNEQPSDYSYTHSTYWQRIIYAALWEPDGTATESDVLSGKTFYSGSNNRVQKTGTAESGTSPGAYNQQYVEYDDYETGDYEGEESSWTNTNALSGSEVWYDTRTGLYWSYSLGSYTNSFPDQDHSSCDFFSTDPRGDYDGSDGDCGNAINACGTLSLASTQGESNDTDWYLPSQKELQEAYADGMYNQAGATFTTTGHFHSSTEVSYSSASNWVVYLYNGSTLSSAKAASLSTRCVRRD